VVEQQAFHGALHDVRELIAAADVRQLVQQNRFHLPRGQSREHSEWQQDHRADVPDYHGYFGEARFKQQHGPRQA